MDPTATDRHIALVGLPGAGKSNIGHHLARLVGRPFADTDQQLELAAGTTIPRLVGDHGEAELRRREQRTLTELLLRFGPLVIAAPGAIALDPDDEALLARTAVVVWIRGPLRLLAGLGDPAHRPRLAGDHHAALARLDAELAPAYARVADHVVDIAPFHAAAAEAAGGEGGREPRRAIARHLLDLLGLPEADRTTPGPPDADLLAQGLADVADLTVDTTDFPDRKGALVRHLLTALADHGITPR